MLLCVVNVDFDITLINIVDFVQTLFRLRVRGENAVCTPSLSNLFHSKDHAKQVRWQVFFEGLYLLCMSCNHCNMFEKQIYPKCITKRSCF